MEFRVKTDDGKQHLVSIGPNGFTVDGQIGDCLVLKEGKPLILGKLTARRDGVVVVGVVTDMGKAKEILPLGVPVEA